MTTVAASSLLIISFVAGGLGFVFLFVSVPLQIFKLPRPMPREEKLHNTGTLLQMQGFCVCCFPTVCIIIANIACAATTLPCLHAEVLLTYKAAFSLAFVMLTPFSLCPLPTTAWSEKELKTWASSGSPLCSQILIWVFLLCYKQSSSAPEMTSFRDIFWRVRSTGGSHLKSLT